MLIPVLALALSTLAAPALGPGECVVFAPLSGPESVFGEDECARRTLPASTFKVPHALIALQTHVVTATSVIKWDGTRRDFPRWNADQTLESSLKRSVVWVYQRFATAIGRERELEHLRAFHYGSATFAGDVTTFWLNGDLRISPDEQVAFLRRMFTYDLPVDRVHIDTVTRDLTMPRGTIENAAGVHKFPLRWPADTIVRAKTGNGTVDGEHVSWLVGELETGGRQDVFASRARSATRTLDTTAGADLALRVLNTIDSASAPDALRQDRSAAPPVQSSTARRHGLVELWAQGKAAFGVYAPNENPGPRGQRGQPPLPALYTRQGADTLAMNPLYDYVFLNLEGSYDAAAVKVMADGLRDPKAVSRKALIVRIPPIDKDGAAAARARVKEILAFGADGVTIPHVTGVDEAKLAIGFFQEAKADVWSPSEPRRPHHRDADARGSGGGRAGERGRGSEGLQHPRLRHRQPGASARRRSRRRRSGHAESAGRSQTRRTRGHAHRQRAGRRAAGEAGFPRAADAGPGGRRSDHHRTRGGRTIGKNRRGRKDR